MEKSGGPTVSSSSLLAMQQRAAKSRRPRTYGAPAPARCFVRVFFAAPVLHSVQGFVDCGEPQLLKGYDLCLEGVKRFGGLLGREMNYIQIREMPPVVVNADDIHQDDIISFNLFAPNLVEEWEHTIQQLREVLTRGGDPIINNARTTYIDNDRPVARLNIAASEGDHILSTSIIIHKEDAYGYSVFSSTRWTCVETPYTLQNAETTHFGPSYTDSNKNIKVIGPQTIYRALLALETGKPDTFHVHFKNLCLVFLESARFHRIYNLVRYSFKTSLALGPPMSRLDHAVDFPGLR